MAANKKDDIMSLAIQRDMQEAIKNHARINNVSASKLIRDLIETYLFQDKKITVIHHEPEFIPIVLKIPSNLRGNKEGILSWLKVRTIAIAERLAMPK